MSASDPGAFGASVTNSVRLWLAVAEGDEPPGSSSARRPSSQRRRWRSEARGVAIDAPDVDEAAEELESWFVDRLTVDPGHPGPFGDLAFDLLVAALDLVDWRGIADALRGTVPTE